MLQRESDKKKHNPTNNSQTMKTFVVLAHPINRMFGPRKDQGKDTVKKMDKTMFTLQFPFAVCAGKATSTYGGHIYS